MKQKDLFKTFNKIKKISIPIILILTMLLWQTIGLSLLEILGINYNELTDISKIIILLTLDLLLIFLLGFIYRKDLLTETKNFFNKNFLKNIKLSFKYWIIGFTIMAISNYIIAIITNGTLATNEQAVRTLIDQFPLYMAFQVMLYAPITEELIFRKSIKKAITNKYIYILASGLVFGGLHVITSITELIDLLYLIPYCSLGIVFATLYYKTNNIYSTITIHSFHNTLAFTLYLLGG